MKYRFEELQIEHLGDLEALRKASEDEETLGPLSARRSAYEHGALTHDLTASKTYGVFHGDTLIGACTAKLARDINIDVWPPRSETQLLLSGLLLLESYRGTPDRVATKLVLYCITSDEANKAELVRLEIHFPASSPGTRARSLYTRLGFLEEEDEVRRYAEDGVEYQVVPMRLSSERFESTRSLYRESRGILPIE